MKHLIGALRHPRDYAWLQLRPWQRHSLVLAIAGPVYIAVGWIYWSTDAPASRLESLRFAVNIMPLRAWGVLWMVVGVLALVSARWPPASKTWGYSAMSGIAWLWSGAYIVGVTLGNAAPTAMLSGGLVWGLVGFLWWAIAGLSNPDDLAVVASHEAWEALAEDEDR